MAGNCESCALLQCRYTIMLLQCAYLLMVIVFVVLAGSNEAYRFICERVGDEECERMRQREYLVRWCD